MRALFLFATATLHVACVVKPHTPHPVPRIDPAPAPMRRIRVLVPVLEAQNADREFRESSGNMCLRVSSGEVCPPPDAQERLARALVSALRQGGFTVGIDPSAPHDVSIHPSLYAMFSGMCRAHAPSAIPEGDREPTYCAIFGLVNRHTGPRRSELDAAVIRMAEGRACGTREGDVGIPQWLIGDAVADEVPPNYAYLAAELVRTLEGCDGFLAYARLLQAGDG